MARPAKNGFGRGEVYRPRDLPTKPIWNRQPEETEKQWAAFLHFRDQGLDRSIERTAKELGYSPNRHGGYLSGWFSQHNIEWRWRERAQAYDDYQQQRIDKAKERAQEKVAARYAGQMERAKLESINDSFIVSGKLMAKAMQIIDRPIEEIEIEAGEDGIKHIHKPVRGVTLAAATQMIGMALQIQQAAIMAASKPEDQCTEVELRAIAEAMINEQQIKAELAAMDAEDKRKEVLAIEAEVVVDDDDSESDDTDES